MVKYGSIVKKIQCLLLGQTETMAQLYLKSKNSFEESVS